MFLPDQKIRKPNKNNILAVWLPIFVKIFFKMGHSLYPGSSFQLWSADI